MKSLYFTGDDAIGYEPFSGMLSIADGSINKIGQPFASSICRGVPIDNTRNNSSSAKFAKRVSISFNC